MNVVTVMSAKGGVGKSTLSANLGFALHLLGHPVLVIDFDSQNSLRFHFSFNRLKHQGIAHTAEKDEPWRDLIEMTEAGIGFLSYGVCDEAQIQRFEDKLRDEPQWLQKKIAEIGLSKDTVVIIDTPPGSTVYLRHALLNSHVVVAVTLPDAGSYTTLPQLQYLIETYCLSNPLLQDYGIVINQVDQSKQLAKDMRTVILEMFKDHLIGEVHLDQSLSEALAYGESIFQYSPHSESAYDIKRCAEWIQRKLSEEK